MSRYVFTRQAVADLEGIVQYVAAERPRAAAHILLKIRKACERTAEWPESGKRRDELASGIRSALVKPYVIFYRYVAGQVQILRILHGRRDIARVFQETPSEP